MSNVLTGSIGGQRPYAATFGEKASCRCRRDPLRGLDLHGRAPGSGRFAGLAEGDAHVVRNAGGRASDDAIRSLVISYKLLGTRSGSSFITPTAAWSSSPTR